MATSSSIEILDLAQAISDAALTIAKSQLRQSNESQTLTNGHHQSTVDDVNGAVGSADSRVNGNADGVKAISDMKKAQAGDVNASQGVLEAKANLIQATSDLSTLVAGPANYLKSLSYGYHDITALSVVLEFGIADAVPLDGSISFLDLSAVVGFGVGRLERILRLLFVRKIFYDPLPGHVAHTPVSAYLAENKDLAAFLGHCTGEAFPAASKLTETIRKYPYTEAPNQAGFNVAFGTDDPLFTFLTKNPERFQRFNLGMAGISQAGGRSASQVVGGYDWASLGKATIVDVGGGNGHISTALAEAYPSLELFVQDLPDAVQAGIDTLPARLASQVKYQAHDMFEPNPVTGADVYYLRHILHDWPDSHAILILKALVPALRNGSRVLVSDSVIPPSSELHGLDEKFVRYLDLQMMVLHNARERTEYDFKSLFAQADPRLKFQRVWRKGESAAASTIVEAQFVS